MPNNDELREEITSIIYGADWKEQDIADAFKPDVEAAMKLIRQQAARAELKLLEDIKDAAKKYVDKLPEEPNMPNNLSDKKAVDRYNKESSDYLSVMFGFDMCFQPVMDYYRRRTAGLKDLDQSKKDKKS